MPIFTVGVNIGARLNRSYRAAFQQARQTANFAGRAIERSGRNAAAGFAGPRGLGPALGGALGGAATAAFLKRSVDTAIQLERAEKSFRKVAGSLSRQQQSSFIENLNRFATSGQTLSTIEQLRRSAATIAQSGVDKGGVQLLDRWVRFAEQASIAFDIPLEQATQQIIELTNALAGDRSLEDQYKEASRLSDIITHLGNNTASSEKKLLPFLHRVAGVAATFGISSENALAFGAALTGAGTPTEKAGTAFNAMLLILSDMNTASKRAKDGLGRLGLSVEGLSRSWTQNADRTFFDFMRTLHEAGAERGAIAKAIFGTEHADEVLKVAAKAWDKYTQAIDLAADKSAVAGARQREAAEVLKGMERDVVQAKNAWTEFNAELGKAVFLTAKPYLQAATPYLTQGAQTIQQNPLVGHAITGALTLGALEVASRVLLRRSPLGALLGGGRHLVGAGVSAATAPAAARRAAQAATSKASTAAAAAQLRKLQAGQAAARVTTAESLYRRAVAAVKRDPTGPTTAADVKRFRAALAAARKEAKKLASASTQAAKAAKAAALAQEAATGAVKATSKGAGRWLRRLLIGGGTALAGGAILDVLLNPAEAAAGDLTAQELAERARRRRGGRGFFGGARFERPGNRPNYLTTRSGVEIFDLPGDRATQAPAITARPGAHSLVTRPAVSPITSLSPRDPMWGERRIAEAMANRWYRGVGQDRGEPIRLKPLVVTGKTTGSGSGIYDRNQPWYGRDWFGNHPDDEAERRRGPWDLGSATPAPDAQPSPAPDIFDDAGGMAGRPVPIDDAALLAELKRSNMLLAQLVANRTQRVSGAPFYDVPSYVNT